MVLSMIACQPYLPPNSFSFSGLEVETYRINKVGRLHQMQPCFQEILIKQVHTCYISGQCLAEAASEAHARQTCDNT